MTIREDFKAKHLAAADTRWEQAIKGVRDLLCYDRTKRYPSFQGDGRTAAKDALVREFTLRMFTVCGQTRFLAFGGIEEGFGIKMDGYGFVSHDPCGLMEFICYFVGHELLDDGTPGVGYYRHTRRDEPNRNDTFVRCGKDDPDARPYFHRSIDLLRQEYPDAEFLAGVDQALEILNFYEGERAQQAANMQAQLDRLGDGAMLDQEHVDFYSKPTSEDQALADLAHEILAEGELQGS